MDNGLDCGESDRRISLKTVAENTANPARILGVEKNMTKIQISFMLLAFAVLSGCDRHPKFADQIAKADRLVVTKKVKGRGFVSMSLDGERARDVVSAVNSGELYGDVAPPVDAAKIEFFKGTNSLGSMYSYDGIFWTKDGEFSDQTGALRMLEKAPAEKWH